MFALGAPKNSRLDLVKVKNDGSTVTFATVAVTDGSAVKGRVTIRVAGRKYNAKVKDGAAKVKLRTFAKPGKYRVVVHFKSNDTFAGARKKITLRVER